MSSCQKENKVSQHHTLVNNTLKPSASYMLYVLNRFGISPFTDLPPAGTCATTAAMTYP